MEVSIYIPDQVWQEDPEYKRYFEAVQHMVNRMAVSHFKYGQIDTVRTIEGLNDMLAARQRMCMYDGIGPQPDYKDINTGNTENVIDAANFLILEYLFPKHKEAHFRAQSSAESPGLAYTE